MARLATVILAVVCLESAVLSAGDDQPNPNGTWKWSVMAGDQTREQTLKLKLEGDKLTGALLGRNDREFPIEEASYKDGTVSFKITRERNGEKVTTKYEGKVTGDTIKGKVQSDRADARSRDWEAKRVSS